MNAKQAKQLDFPELLRKMGHHPVRGGIKKGGSEIWYKSPLSNENTPSFHLTRGKQVAWVFKCFSTGEEGHILDFVIAHEGYPKGDIKSALAFLRDKFPGPLFERSRAGDSVKSQHAFSFHEHDPPADNEETSQSADRDLEYLEDLPLKSKQILDYLEQQRKIPAALAQRYLRLVRYKNLKKGKAYYAFGMKNRAGGFEIRAASDVYSFKSALIARDITIIPGDRDQRSVLVFEGMTDFLSFLVIEGEGRPFCDAVILHSVNSYQACLDNVRSRNYRRIHTFLDNDETGRQYTNLFAEDFGALHVSHSTDFAPHKDVNAALQAGLDSKFFPSKKDNPFPPRPEPDQ